MRHPSTGHLVRVTAVERHTDPIAQILTEQWRFAELDHDGQVLREELENLALRWTYRYEMAHLLELCGFEPLAEYSDYEVPSGLRTRTNLASESQALITSRVRLPPLRVRRRAPNTTTLAAIGADRITRRPRT